MKHYLFFTVLAFALQGCTSTQSQPARTATNTVTSASCPSNAAELGFLKTEQQVIGCLGQSNTTTSNPDGRHTALYRFKGGIIIVFLFSKDGSVIRHNAYQDSNAK